MDVKELDRRFTYHAPKGDQPERYSNIRASARLFAMAIVSNTPESCEQTRALHALDEAVMLANAAIARNE